MSKLITRLGLIGGLLLSLTGGGFIFMYVAEGIVARIGEPDQSLLFWYLPILFLGIFGLMAGLALLLWAWKRLKGT